MNNMPLITEQAFEHFYNITCLSQYYDTRVRHYTLKQHTQLVCSEYEKHFNSIELPIDKALFATLLVLHDIGKPQAYKDGNKSLQHTYTPKIIQSIDINWQNHNFSAQEKNIIITFTHQDSLGEYMQDKKSVNQTIIEIKQIADEINMSIEDTFYLLSIYYQCDVASYTQDAGGLFFLEKMFEYKDGKKLFDSQNQMLSFSKPYQIKYNQLKDKIFTSNHTNMDNITFIKGNIFNSNAQTIVNTVNCVGVMGKGVALVFKLRYPKMFEQYKKYCDDKLINIGTLWLYKGEPQNPWVLNFPTKNHWKFPSKIEYLEKGLQKFIDTYESKGITSIAFPLLGTHNGGLDKAEVLNLMQSYLKDCKIPIEIYEYDPYAKDDLFDSFKTKWFSIDNKKNIISGIRQNQIDAINYAIENGNQSMISLIESDGIGFKTMEKCFRLVMDYDSANNTNKSNDLSLFD